MRRASRARGESVRLERVRAREVVIAPPGSGSSPGGGAALTRQRFCEFGPPAADSAWKIVVARFKPRTRSCRVPRGGSAPRASSVRPRRSWMMSADNEYEAARAARIAANKERMRALGLGSGGQHQPVGLSDEAESGAGAPSRRGQARAQASQGARRWKQALRARAPPERTSRRLRGFNADGTPADKPVVVRSSPRTRSPARAASSAAGSPSPTLQTTQTVTSPRPFLSHPSVSLSSTSASSTAPPSRPGSGPARGALPPRVSGWVPRVQDPLRPLLDHDHRRWRDRSHLPRR